MWRCDLLSEWVSLNVAAGELVVDKPSDFSGNLEINLKLPNGEAFNLTVD